MKVRLNDVPVGGTFRYTSRYASSECHCLLMRSSRISDNDDAIICVVVVSQCREQQCWGPHWERWVLVDYDPLAHELKERFG
jgi:hypothetical protein